MSKYANPGELRTPVVFRKVTRAINANGFPEETETALFGGEAIFVKWVNAHGTEVWEHAQQSVRDRATLTLRYSPALTDETLLAYRDGTDGPFEIVSADDVENRHVWLELTVQRKVSAR